jgi:O-antigen/teichoic acid export membrane protein
MGEARVVAKNTGVLVLVEVVRKAFGLLLFMAVARRLGAANFGILAFGLAFTELLGVVNKFGFEPFILREVARHRDKAQSYWANMAIIKLFLAVPYVGLVVGLSFVMGVGGLKLTVVYICTVDTFFQNFVLHNCDFFRAYQKAEYEAITRLSLSAMYWLLGWGIILLGYGLLELAAVLACVKFFSFCVSLYLIHTKISPIRLRFEPAVAKEVLKGAFPFLAMAVVTMIQGRVGVVVLSPLKGDEVTGMYAAAMRLFMIFSFIPIGIRGGFLPAMSKFAAGSAEQQVGKAFRYSFKYLLIVALPIAIASSILPDRIIHLVYGVKFSEAAGILRIVMWGLLITFVNYSFGSVLIAVNREKAFLVILSISAGISVISNLILVPFLSATGSAISLVLTQGFVLLACVHQVQPYLKVDLELLDTLFKPFLGGLIMAVGLYLLHGSNLFLSLPAGVVIYLASLIVVRTFNSEERHLLRDVVRQLARA